MDALNAVTSSATFLQPLKSLFVSDTLAPSNTRFVEKKHWMEILGVLDACFCADDDSKCRFLNLVCSATRNNSKLSSLQSVAIIGSLCLLADDQPPLSAKINWDTNIVLASISGLEQRAYAVPATKDQVSLHLDSYLDPSYPATPSSWDT
jgi:hypothetical protein